jgi:hypothetical protein
MAMASAATAPSFTSGEDLLEYRNPAAVHVGDLSLDDLLVLEALGVIGG